jgi:hypothetical protein
VSWNDAILVLGGDPDFTSALKYNVTVSDWATTFQLDTPFTILFSGCSVLPDMNILVALGGGQDNSGQSRKYTEYNVTSNSWSQAVQGNVSLDKPILVQLGAHF